MSTFMEPLNDVTRELEDAAGKCEDAKAAVNRAIARRREAVLAARKAGMSHGAIAKRLGLTQPRVVQIVAGG